MLLTKREEQVLKAFLEFGKLSLANISDILKVSQRTVYRTLADLTESLSGLDIQLVKEGSKYLLVGDLEKLASFSSQESFDQNDRLNLITYELLVQADEITNEQLQEKFKVSNVTIIQDIADIEARLADFDIRIIRKKGYKIAEDSPNLRWFLAILLTNNLSVSNFWTEGESRFNLLDSQKLTQAKSAFQTFQQDLPELDAKLREFFIILLALSGWQSVQAKTSYVSKVALDFAQKVYSQYAQDTSTFHSIQEILYYASVLDELVIKRQETPLFQENFDSEFFYNVSNLIDKVALYTKINFTKDRTLFKFLFNHIRLNLAAPVIFPDYFGTNVTHQALQDNDYLHQVVSLLVQDIFPKYLQREFEYELISLHFASSLRRSPDIYPIRLLLLTNERPLTSELLVTRIKNIAPFVREVIIKDLSQYQDDDLERYDCIFSTKPLSNSQIEHVSIYPDAKEILRLQEKLETIQANRRVIIREDLPSKPQYDLQKYFLASQELLSRFSFKLADNPDNFEDTVSCLLDDLDGLVDKAYIGQKLLERFKVSPLAIPNTNLALLHTQSSRIEQSTFVIYELNQPVSALSMNHQEEEVSRILIMLTRMDEGPEIRELMTAISQSLIENHLYTEIYKTGNREIIYQLLNQIFTDKIKKLED